MILRGKVMNYICPVCGFDELKQQPYDELGNESFDVCPCCFFEFGVDDMLYTFEEYRKKWLSDGAKWQSSTQVIKENWNPQDQLKNIQKIIPTYSRHNQRKLN